MKKILFIAALLLAVVELNAHGACLIENLKMKSECTGGASSVKIPQQDEEKENARKKEIENMYSVPTMAVPYSYKDNFPMLNQNCMFGACFPR